ncbi:MAG: hypothetical protein DRJ51_06715 [Thermoprotei archaeon]|nr:MAG: hypothetical protein DRJ51_06715 [Thermoprotei archaeon]
MMTIVAVMLGWIFEALDFMLLPLLAVPIMGELSLSKMDFSYLISVGLLGTVLGGVLAGMLADKFGRRKVLYSSLLMYSLGTIMLSLSQSFQVASVARLIIGIGLSAEWSTGMALISENVPAKCRGKAVGLAQSGWPVGVMLAILMVMEVYPHIGWRGCFLAAVLPVPLIIFLISRSPESKLWLSRGRETRTKIPLTELFKKPYVKTTLLALLMNVLAMFSYWMFWSWIPTYLYEERGLDVVKSAEWLITTQVGAWLGYISYGYFQDRVGRRPAWAVFTATEALAIFIYLSPGITKDMLLFLGFILGYFTGFWSGFGALLSELFPTRIRSTALGFVFNAGRAINFISPSLVALLSSIYGWNTALSTASIAALLASLIIWAFPETRGKELD